MIEKRRPLLYTDYSCFIKPDEKKSGRNKKRRDYETLSENNSLVLLHSSSVSGYQIRYSTDKKFKKKVKTKKVADPSKKTITIKKLKARKTYYFQIRTCKILKKTDGSMRTEYGSWSKTVKKKIKK